MPEDPPPAYWLGVCRGREAAIAWMQVTGDNLGEVFDAFPILALPEFPAAIAALAESVGQPELAESCADQAEHLRDMMDRIQREAIELYSSLLYNCATDLMDEFQGSHRRNLLRSIELFLTARQGFGPTSPSFARALMNEGNARLSLADLGAEPRGNLDAAVRLYAEARGIFDTTSPNFASALMNEGNARQRLADLGAEPRGNLDAAVRLYAEARGIFDTTSPDFARALGNEGSARLSLANLGAEPRANLEHAVKLYHEAGEQFLGLGHQRDALTAFANLARMARKEARASEGEEREAAWRRSRDAWARAVTAAEAVRAQIGESDQRRDWLGLQAPVYAGAVEASLELGAFDQALEFAERGRGRTLIDLLNLRENRPNGVEDAVWADYQEIIRTLEAMERITSRPADANDSPTGERSAGHFGTGAGTAATGQRTGLLARLADHEKVFRKADPEYFAAAEPPNAAKIQAIANKLQRIVVVPWIGGERSCAFLVRPGETTVEAVDLPGLTTATVRAWMFRPADDPAMTGWLGTYLHYRETARPRTIEEVHAHVAARRAWFGAMTATLAEVHQALVAPIDRALGLGDAGRPTPIALLAGGLLGLLPLHAARPSATEPGTAGEFSQCWLDRVEVIYGPSIAVLGRCEERKRPGWSPALGVIDPASNLKFSQWEGLALGNRVTGKEGRFTALFQNNATLAAVRSRLGGKGLVHFACHGGWNPSDPLESGLEMFDDMLKLRELLRDKSCEDARLVTLSACETGLGHDFSKRDEEYLGLPAGFLLGGARAVVGSLWTVADPITALLMDAFYERLLAGKGLAESLREAQIWLRSLSKDDAIARLRQAGTTEEDLERVRLFLKGADDAETLEHPYYWAGFAAYGAAGPVVAI